MTTKPASRQAIKSPDPEISLKGSEQKLPSTSDISKTAKTNYRTKLLNASKIEYKTPLTWMDLTADDIQDLVTGPIQDLPGKIAAIFHFSEWQTELKDAMWVSIYVGCVKFAKDCDFSPAQISAFFSIYKESIERISKSGAYLQQGKWNWNSGNSGDDWDVFGTREAKLSIDYAFSTLFQHFRLYQQVLSQEQEIVEIVSVRSLEVPLMEPLPLAEALTKDQYLQENGLQGNNAGDDSMVSDAEDSHAEEKYDQNELDKAHEEKDVPKEVVQENPLDILSPEEIRKITADTINSLFSSVNQDYDALFEDQKTRFMNQISKFVSN